MNNPKQLARQRVEAETDAEAVPKEVLAMFTNIVGVVFCSA
ncbi:hypothetical protein C7S13_4716 [Burkholderia cepacia]|nr:hypothetical protein [Burkholderia cepacia]